MRAVAVAILVVGLAVLAGSGRAEEPKSARAQQRALVLASWEKLRAVHDAKEMLVSALIYTKDRSEKGLASRREAEKWLADNRAIVNALERKQAELYAEMIAAGETP